MTAFLPEVQKRGEETVTSSVVEVNFRLPTPTVPKNHLQVKFLPDSEENSLKS
jgi:hypothetical protein